MQNVKIIKYIVYLLIWIVFSFNYFDVLATLIEPLKELKLTYDQSLYVSVCILALKSIPMIILSIYGGAFWLNKKKEGEPPPIPKDLN